MQIAILGSHPATKALAPFRDPAWRIFACSPHNCRNIPRVDSWYEMHVPVAHQTRPPEYLDWLRRPDRGFTLLMRDRTAMPDYPGAVAYPEEQADQIFGPFWKTSSIAFMLADALMQIEAAGEPDNRIGLWGIMQASKTEYVYQRPTIQQFIWEASKRQIEVTAPRLSGLFAPPAEEW